MEFVRHLKLATVIENVPSIVYKVTRRDAAIHSFKYTRRRLDEARRCLTSLRNRIIAEGNRQEKEKKGKRKTRKGQM